MNELWRKWKWFLHRNQYERELDEEMRHHLALKAEEQGSAETARRKFGNTTLLKEDSRAMWIGTYGEQLVQDMRYALRAMAAHKLFTGMAVLSLALGIGANTAIFSFMDAIMIRALPVRHPEQLAIVNWRSKGGEAAVVHDHDGSSYADGGWQTSPNFPYPAYELLQKSNHVFSTLFGYANAGRLNLVLDRQAVLGEGQYVSGNYFDSLGVTPAIGRLIGTTDDRPGAAPVVNLSYNFWQSRLGARADLIGKTILINGKPFSIVGVTPPEFFGVRPPRAPEVFIPVRDLALIDLNMHGELDKRFIGEHSYWIEMMGRVKPGVSLSQAEAELRGQFRPWVQSTASNDKERLTVPELWLQEGGSGVDALRRQYSKPLLVLMIMVGLILIIACANIANLLLTRAHTRRREIAVRLSLGAGRWRVIRQLLTESILLSFCGGLLGLLIASLSIRALTAMLGNGQEDFTLRAELDWRVLLFNLLVVLLTGLLFGLAPALQATKVDVTPALKETRASAPNRRGQRAGVPFSLSQALIVAQIAISLLLVAAAGLFVRTLNNLHAVDLGFNPQNVLLFSINAAQAGYKDAALRNFYTELHRRFALIPGVRNATMTHMPLVANWTSSTGVIIPGSSKPDGKRQSTSIVQVGPGFFGTMQIPILMGRAIDERDVESAPLTAVVNEIFAKKYFPGESPIGQRFGLTFGKNSKADIEIVGLAKTARYNSLKRDIPPVVYTSYLQTGKNRPPLEQMYFELRTAGDPLSVADSVRRIVHEIAPTIPIANLSTQSQVIEGTIVQERTFASLCTAFGLLALVMACIGLYGTLAYAVARRTGEIGIRMALGAARGSIIWMVLREVLVLMGIGLIVGITAVWQTTAFLQSFLFGLKPNDLWTLGSAVAILIACAILAGYAPAWRAARVDPASALRHE
jgi:macrolide transport system ATP-binding/permease protein